MWTSKQWFPKSDQYHFLKFGFLIESDLRTDEINIVTQMILNHKSCILDADIQYIQGYTKIVLYIRKIRRWWERLEWLVSV